jgi:hypothetical protein
VGVLLMNKLYEDKRYDDVVRVFDKQESIFVPRSEDDHLNIEVFLDALFKQVFFSTT